MKLDSQNILTAALEVIDLDGNIVGRSYSSGGRRSAMSVVRFCILRKPKNCGWLIVLVHSPKS